MRRAVRVDGGDDIAALVADGGRHRVGAVGELFEHPGETGLADFGQSPAQAGGVGDRAAGERLQRPLQVGVDEGRLGPGEEHQARRHGVHHDALAGPVAHLHLVVGVGLVDVVSHAPVGHRQPGCLARATGEFHQVRPSTGHERPPGHHGRGDLDEARADAVVATCGHLLDHAQFLERRQQARHGALRQLHLLGQLGDPGGARRERAEHGEGSIDRLHGAHTCSIIRHRTASWNSLAPAPAPTSRVCEQTRSVRGSTHNRNNSLPSRRRCL